MSKPKSLNILDAIKLLKSLKDNIRVPCDFKSQMVLINTLLRNDKTGIISTVLDFMVHSASVPLTIESGNDTLNENLKIWQEKILNNDIAIDIPSGLRDLSVQYFKERWKSSLLVLNIEWETVNFGGNNGEFIMPKFMWFADGSAVQIDGDTNSLNGKKYIINEKEIKSTVKRSVLIRRPYNTWYDGITSPYLVNRGVLFNALLKNAIVDKQAEVIEAVIPYLLTLKAGNDKLAEQQMLATEEELRELKESIVRTEEDSVFDHDRGKKIAALNYDVNIEHLMPDLKKIFDISILKSVDKDLLAGLGLIELEGFAKNRQETILNPKVLVEEVRDAVKDWTNLLGEVMQLMLDKNAKLHRNLANNDIRVIPGTIKTFMTDNMKDLIKTLYDRGIVSKQSVLEDTTDLNFGVQLDRRENETTEDLDDKLYPPVTQNLEQHQNADDIDTEVPDDRKPNTPEVEDFKEARKHRKCDRNKKKKCKDKKYSLEEIEQAPFDTIDQLPKSVKSSLPVLAQVLFLKIWNESFKKNGNIEKSFEEAWSVISDQYKKVPSKTKWIKK